MKDLVFTIENAWLEGNWVTDSGNSQELDREKELIGCEKVSMKSKMDMT